MSFSEFLNDVAHLNFSNAYKRAMDWWHTDAPDWLKAFVVKVEQDAGKLLISVAEEGAKAVLAGGLTTDSFVNAAKAMEEKLVTDGKTFSRQQVFAALNLAVDALKGNDTSSVSP